MQRCTDPNCVYNKRGIQHTCGQCSMMATVKCACWQEHLKTKPYTAQGVREAVEPNVEQLIKPWSEGRPANWVPDPNTKELIALGYWLHDELTRIAAHRGMLVDDVRTQCWKYNRLSRTYDIWETAAECLNEMLEDKVEKNRIGHRRWG